MKTKIYSFNYSFALLGMLLIFSLSCKKDDNITLTGTVTDVDGNTYKTIKIGDQWWMAENLKVTRYRNHEAIDSIASTGWNRTTGAYCVYDISTANIKTYGKLYNWYAVNDPRNIAPEGWHVPTDAEWTTLTTFLGGEELAGGKLKETGITHWKDPNTEADNESGFSALPGGSRNWDGTFDLINGYGFWWSTTAADNEDSWSRYIKNDKASVTRYGANNKDGFSVRCIKD
jgi:uncharacterized protein (TIGR02145 family)